jgi:hypothetical protein
MNPPDPGELLANLNAGVFAQQVGKAISDVAAGVVDHSKKGQVIIVLDMTQIDGSHQVSIQHTLKYTAPTKRGKRYEDTSLKTPMHVTANGLQLFAESATGDMFKNKEQSPSQPAERH